MTQQEDAIINLVINGNQAITTFKELNKARAEQLRLVQGLNRNAPEYAQQRRRLEELNAAQRVWRNEINEGTQAIRQQNAVQRSFFQDFRQNLGGLGSIAGGVTTGMLAANLVTGVISSLKGMVTSVVQAYTTFEKFDAVLTNTLGDSGSSRRALNMLQQFAAETPFALEELTGSYVKLANRGIIPTMDEMRLMGDLAASQGKSFDQLTEAILDAVTGEFERLKEFGIRAKKNGDMVQLSFKGITMEVKNSEEAIQSAILKFGAMDGVAGGMEKMSKTVGGAISNIGDNWDRFLTTIGGKTSGWLKIAVDNINTFLNFAVEAVKSADQRVKEAGDAYAQDAMKRYKRMKPEDQVALYGGSKDELKYFEDQVAKKEAEIASLRMVRGNGDKIDNLRRDIDDLNLNIAKTESFIEAVDADNAQTANVAKMKAEQIAREKAEREKQEAEKRKKQAEQDRKATVTALAALAKDYKDFEAGRLLDTLAANDKEVQALDQKFEAEIQKQREALTRKQITEDEKATLRVRMKALSAEKEKAIDDLRVSQSQKITEDIAAFNEALTNKLKSELDKELEYINKNYDERLKTVGKNQKEIDKIEAGRKAAISIAKDKDEQRLLDAAKKIQEEGDALRTGGDDMSAINQKYNAELQALQDKFGKEYEFTAEYLDAVDMLYENWELERAQKEKDVEKEKQAARKAFALDAAQSVADAIFTIGQRNRDAETDSQLKKLNDQKDVELSNKNLTEDQKRAINEKYAKKEAAIKKAAWEAQKAADIKSAIIAGALAVVRALPNPFAAAAAGVAAAAQVAVIASQKTPEFADGGIPDGPSHAQGGMKLVGPYGQVYGEIEGGEPVLSRATYANNKGLIDALLNSGGAPLNYDRVVDATNSREQRRSFNSSATMAPAAGAATNTAMPGSSARLDRIEQMLVAMVEVQRTEQQKPVVLSRRVEEQESARVVEIRNDANA